MATVTVPVAALHQVRRRAVRLRADFERCRAGFSATLSAYSKYCEEARERVAAAVAVTHVPEQKRVRWPDEAEEASDSQSRAAASPLPSDWSAVPPRATSSTPAQSDRLLSIEPAAPSPALHAVPAAPQRAARVDPAAASPRTRRARSASPASVDRSSERCEVVALLTAPTAGAPVAEQECAGAASVRVSGRGGPARVFHVDAVCNDVAEIIRRTAWAPASALRGGSSCLSVFQSKGCPAGRAASRSILRGIGEAALAGARRGDTEVIVQCCLLSAGDAFADLCRLGSAKECWQPVTWRCTAQAALHKLRVPDAAAWRRFVSLTSDHRGTRPDASMATIITFAPGGGRAPGGGSVTFVDFCCSAPPAKLQQQGRRSADTAAAAVALGDVEAALRRGSAHVPKRSHRFTAFLGHCCGPAARHALVLHVGGEDTATCAARTMMHGLRVTGTDYTCVPD